MNKSILGGAAIIAVALIFVQVSKQNSIERQQTAELDYKRFKESEIELRRRERENELALCLYRAEENYEANWSANCKLESKLADCNSLSNYHADNVETARKDEKALCLKMYN